MSKRFHAAVMSSVLFVSVFPAQAAKIGKDPWAAVTETPAEVLEKLANILEVRAANPQQKTMRDVYFKDIKIPTGTKIRVLEVGSGTGAVTRALATLPGVESVVGLDPSPFFVKKAIQLNQNQNVSFVVGDGLKLPYEDNSFDLIVFHTTLCHVLDPGLALKEAFRVLRSGGWVAVFDGNYIKTKIGGDESGRLQTAADAAMAAYVTHRDLISKLDSMVHTAGFEVKKKRTFRYEESGKNVEYMLSVATRGADAMLDSGQIKAHEAEALKQEANRLAKDGKFQGSIEYASFVAQKPSSKSVH